jgi:hypothetical protein
MTPHNSTKTRCKRGHPLSGENLHVRPDGSRSCKACQRLHQALSRKRNGPRPRPTGEKPIPPASWFNGKYREAPGGCWLFAAGLNRKGYGVVGYRSWTWLAHRLMYAASFGDFDRRLFVLHRCDVPSCINPAHLFLGTNEDNMKDMVTKGRQARGEAFGEKIARAVAGSLRHSSKTGAYRKYLKVRTGSAHPLSKLTDAQCDHLRLIYSLGIMNVRTAGLFFGVCEETARGVIKGRRKPPSERPVS